MLSNRYDLFRMLAVYFYGGFYFDMDFEPLRKLPDSLLKHDVVFPHEEYIPAHICERHGRAGRWPWSYIDCSFEFPQLGQFGFGARQGNDFIRQLIYGMRDQFYNPDVPPRYPDVYVFTTSGPDFVSHMYNQSSKEVQSTVTVLYPEPYAKFQFGNYGRHHMGGSWRNK